MKNKCGKVKIFVVGALMILGITGLMSCAQSDKSVDETLSQIAAEANKELPKMIDAETRLDKITTQPGRIIQYNNTIVDLALADVDLEAFKASANRTLSAIVKNNPSLQSFRNRNVIFKYRYQDKTGAEVAVFEYTPESYK